MEKSGKTMSKHVATLLLSIIITISSVFMSTPLQADADKIKQKYKPSYGVQYKSVNNGVNVMEMDISDMFTEVQLGKPDPLDKLMTVKDRANTYSKSGNQIVVAINANFYDINKKRPVHIISSENRRVYSGYYRADRPVVTSPLAFKIDSKCKGMIGDFV